MGSGRGILRAVREDIEGGYLKRIEALVSADIFTDFLEMAEHLLEKGYKDPAASLVGAVLEDGLRKICAKISVTVKSQEDISSLNKKLADAQVYNRLMQKKVQVWNDIRNNADHAKFSEYSKDDVKEMLKGVTDFLAQYL
ncbi:MAG: HEPN domain-containing protein [Pyrinomonadaceae bacterium]